MNSPFGKDGDEPFPALIAPFLIAAAVTGFARTGVASWLECARIDSVCYSDPI